MCFMLLIVYLATIPFVAFAVVNAAEVEIQNSKFDQCVFDALNGVKSIISDPFPLEKQIDVAINNGLYTLTGKILDIEYTGASEMEIQAVQSDLSQSIIDLSLIFHNASLNGYFMLEGSVGGAVPIGGRNSWSIHCKHENGANFIASLYYELEGGYVVLKDPPYPFALHDMCRGGNVKVPSFPGLLDESLLGSEIAKEIMEGLSTLIHRELENLMTNPFKIATERILQREFNKKTLLEIIL